MKRKSSRFLLAAAAFAVCGAAAAQTQIGVRPYEMDWANRTEDQVAPTVDFETMGEWRVEAKNVVATFEPSREQQLFGRGVAKFSYRGLDSTKSAEARILAPQPIPIGDADTIRCWIYGNRWGFENDTTTPPASINATFLDGAGQPLLITLTVVNWKEWWLVQRRFSDAEKKRLQGGTFTGFEVNGITNSEPRALYFDDLALYREVLAPLSFAPRPARAFQFAGQNQGTNTGPGKLNFPTREQTILPDNLTKNSKVSLARKGAVSTWTYRGSDGVMTCEYSPKSGALDDITLRWKDANGKARGGVIVPCAGGGVRFDVNGKNLAPQKAELVSQTVRGAALEIRWKLSAGGFSQDVIYTLQLRGKTLALDVRAADESAENRISEIRYGSARGLDNPRLVTSPYYNYASGTKVRPAFVVSGNASTRLFLAGNTDWYRSNSSELFADNNIENGRVSYNGGTRYIARTDGKRNAIADRFFISLSPRFEEVLPNIPNPMSPYKKVMAPRLWTPYGVNDREADKKMWAGIRRHGLTQIIITDHETMWRDAGESFTFRTRTAPGRGGDESAREYSQYLQKTLGYVYGPYNNFTDIAPVNGNWNEGMAARFPDNQLRTGWSRNYLAKPSRAVEFGATQPFINQKKFDFSTAYCDVHTALAPWYPVDFDARVPGAGTFAGVFYAYGELMELQKKAWRGPVYSEGGFHFYYTGLTDGNYAQDQSYLLPDNPWLVDLDLRKMHPLGTNFGMGSTDMFYAPGSAPASPDEKLQRLLAATIAFGHTGMLEVGQIERMMRMYFPIQGLQSRYALGNATTISYLNAAGKPEDVSAALQSGAFRRNQIVTRYDNGTTTVVNGSKTARLRWKDGARNYDLPPNGFAGWTNDGKIATTSADRDGRRFTYSVSPDYIYADATGRFTRFERAATDGQAVCLIKKDSYEIIPMNGANCGFAINATGAVALDKDGKKLGAATLRRARGLTYVIPVKGAFSYRLAKAVKGDAATPLASTRDFVVAGESVEVRGKTAHTVVIPASAQPGERVWKNIENRWIDFTVAPPLEARPQIVGNALRLVLRSNLASTRTVKVQVGAQSKNVVLKPAGTATLDLPLDAPAAAGRGRILNIAFSAPATKMAPALGYVVRRALLTRENRDVIRTMTDAFSAGMQRRGAAPTNDLSDSGAIVQVQNDIPAGNVKRSGVFIHPPWKGTTGIAFARWNDIQLPKSPVVFRAFAGKQNGSYDGDGILFKVVVVDKNNRETTVAQLTATKHEWLPLEADLSPWAGQKIALIMLSDPGPEDDTSGDWSIWGEPRIEAKTPQITYVLDDEIAPYQREAAPFSAKGIALAQLREAKAAWLHYQGIGLTGNAAPYITTASLNGVSIGALLPAGGDEAAKTWSDDTKVPLTKEAIASLKESNVLQLQNTSSDYFAVRRFWLEVELNDGRKVSTQISSAAYVQPPGWPPGSGVAVPFEKNIETTLDFDF